MGGALIQWGQSPYKKRHGSAPSISLLCEDTVRRRLSASLEEGPHQKLILLELDLELPSLWNCKKIHFCCLGHMVCVISPWQP